jgi:RNA polymerase sigma-70 factor, ECF subfamily
MKSTPQEERADADLVARAVAGDRVAYDTLVGPALPKLRATVGRLLGNPDETEDVVQQTLLRGWGSLGGFAGRSRFSTWLCSIGVRIGLDHLRQARRWRAGAQLLYADACRDDDSRAASLVGAMHSPGAAFDAREHIAFCLVCVGRSLPADAHVAVVSRDLLGMSIEEGAEATGMSRGAFRHRLAEGRALLVERYEGLCALVNQEGPCWQCAGLRQVAPPDRRGDDPPALPGTTTSATERHQARVAIAKAADLAGPSHALHDLMARSICALEESGWGDEAQAGTCGPPELEA